MAPFFPLATNNLGDDIVVLTASCSSKSKVALNTLLLIVVIKPTPEVPEINPSKREPAALPKAMSEDEEAELPLLLVPIAPEACILTSSVVVLP